MVAPLTIAVTGVAILPLHAERALLDVEITSTGSSRPDVSEDVQDSARRLEDLLRKMSAPVQNIPESATIAHWSMTDLKTTSHLPTTEAGGVMKGATTVYSTSVSFDVRIRDFSKLGTFAAQVSTLQHTVIHSVRWALTPETRRKNESTLRRMAAKDALDRAKDYAIALGLRAVWPVSIEESQWGSHDPGAKMRIQQAAMGLRRPVVDPDPAFADLFFEPDEVKMTARVDCKFKAE